MADNVVTLRLVLNDGNFAGKIELDGKALKGLGTAGQKGGKQAAAGIDRVASSTKGLSAQLDHARTSATKTFSSTRRGVESISNSLVRAQRVVGAFYAAQAAMASVSSITRMADEYTNLSSKIALVTDSQREATAVQKQVFEIAQETRSALASTGDLYTKLARSTGDMGLSQQALLDITRTINQSFVVSGASAGEANAAIQQLGQGLAAGALRGDEFNSVAEQAPIIMDLLAAKLHMSRGELREFAAEGKITAEIMVSALAEGADTVAAQFGGMQMTIGGAAQQFKNAMTLWVGEAGKASGVARLLADGISLLAKHFNALVNVAGAAAVAWLVTVSVRSKAAAASAIQLAEAQAIEARAALSAASAARANALAKLTQAKAGYAAALASQELMAAELAESAAARTAGVAQTGLAQATKASKLRMFSLTNVLAVLSAAAAGWQFGTYLRDKFQIVADAGAYLVYYIKSAWDELKTWTQIVWKGIELLIFMAIDKIRGKIADMVESIADMGQFEIMGKTFGVSDETVTKLDATALAIRGTGGAAQEVAKDITRLKDSLGGARDANKAMLDSMLEQNAWEHAQKGAKGLANGLGEVANNAGSAATGLAGTGNAASEAAKSIEDYIEQLKAANDMRAALGPNPSEADSERYKLANTPGITPELLAAGNTEIDRSAELDAVDRAAQAMTTLHSIYARNNDQIIDMQAALAGASRGQIEFNRTQRDAKQAYEAAGGAANKAAQAAYDATVAQAAQKQQLDEALDNKLITDQLFDQINQKGAFDPLIDEAHKLQAALDGVFGPLSQAQVAAFQARVNQIHMSQIVSGSIDALRAVQTFTKQGSKEYEAMSIAINALGIVQAVSAVLNQGTGDPYTAFARMAAMAAAVAPLVAQIGGSIASVRDSGFTDTAAQRQASQGTGSVLGDAEAKSESIANATKITADATSVLVGINRGMLRALQSLQAGLSSAGGMLARGAGDADFTGMTNPASSAFLDIAAMGDPLFEAGDLFGLFEGSSKITDQGIIIFGGALNDLLEGIAIGAYQEVQSKSWAFGSTHTDEAVASVSDAFATQFQLVLNSIAETVRAGATALGLLPAEIEAAIAAFEIAEIHISLKGLSAEEKQAALEAVFSSIFDGLAAAVVPFIDQFQKVGEGLGETLIRVATDVQVMQEAVRQMGLTLDVTDPERFAQISVGLIELAGGVEKFISGMQSFVDKFAPEDFKTQLATDTLTMALDQVGLSVPKTREEMWALMQSLDASTEAGREQIATLLRLADVSDQYYDTLEKNADDAAAAMRARFDYASLSAGLHAEAGQNPLATSLLEIAKWSQDTTKRLHDLAAAAGLAGAKESDLALVHQIAAKRIEAAIAALYESSRALVDQLYGTSDVADTASSAVSGFGNAMQTAAQTATDAINLLLGNLSPFSDQKKLDIALQGQLAGTVTPQQVLEIGRRLMASGADYAQLFARVMAVGDRTGGGLGGGRGGIGGGTAAREIAEKTLSKAERYQLADQLANNIADLAAAQNISFADVADKLGLDLADLGKDLGLGDKALGDYLTVLGSDNFGLSDLKGVLAEQVDRLIVAIGGSAINPAEYIDMSGAHSATYVADDEPIVRHAVAPHGATYVADDEPIVRHAVAPQLTTMQSASPEILRRLESIEQTLGVKLDEIGRIQGRYMPQIADNTDRTADSTRKSNTAIEQLADKDPQHSRGEVYRYREVV